MESVEIHVDGKPKEVELQTLNKDIEQNKEQNLMQENDKVSDPEKERGGCCCCKTKEDREKHFLFFLLLVSTALINSDQGLLAPNFQAIAAEFEIPKDDVDARLGMDVSLALFLFGAPVGLMIGYLAGFHDRRKLYCLVLVLSGIGAFFTFFSTQHWQLIFLRCFSGVGLGGGLPIVFSMSSDLFPVQQRTIAAAAVGIFAGLGQIVGMGLGGFLGSSIGWRTPFMAVSIPTFIIAALLMMCKEPVRGSQEAAVQNKETVSNLALEEQDVKFIESNKGNQDGEVVGNPAISTSAGPTARGRERVASVSDNGSGSLDGSHDGSRRGSRKNSLIIVKTEAQRICAALKIRSNMLLFLQGLPGCIPWGVVTAFANSFLSENKGISIVKATAILLTFGVGCFFGLLLGGCAGQKLYNWKKPAVCIAMGVTTAAGTFPLFYIIAAPYHDIFTPMMAFFGGVLASAPSPNVRALIQNVNVPELRGVMFGVANITDDLGRAFGPVVVVAMESFLSRGNALADACFFWVLCGAIMAAVSIFVVDDEAAVQKHVAEQVREQEQELRNDTTIREQAERRNEPRVSAT